MCAIKATRIPQFVMESQEYMFVGQAVNISRRILPAYSSKFSKKKYRQYQLFVILLYKAWRNVGYRDAIEIISSNPAFIDLLSLPETPHFTAIQKFSERIDKGLIGFVFSRTLKSFIESLGGRMIVDSTGYSVNYHSYYYDRRLGDFGGKPKKRYVKTTICVDDKSQLIVSYSARFGYVHDSREFKKMLKSMDKAIADRFRVIVGDKGYDLEENHIVARRYGLFAIIPARNEGVPIHRTRGENRKRMKRHLPEEYSRRPIVETVHSVIKRKSGSFVRSRIPGQLEKEMALKIIAYNIRRILMLNNSGSKIIFMIEDFYRAT